MFSIQFDFKMHILYIMCVLFTSAKQDNQDEVELLEVGDTYLLQWIAIFKIYADLSYLWMSSGF